MNLLNSTEWCMCMMTPRFMLCVFCHKKWGKGSPHELADRMCCVWPFADVEVKPLVCSPCSLGQAGALTSILPEETDWMRARQCSLGQSLRKGTRARSPLFLALGFGFDPEESHCRQTATAQKDSPTELVPASPVAPWSSRAHTTLIHQHRKPHMPHGRDTGPL